MEAKRAITNIVVVTAMLLLAATSLSVINRTLTRRFPAIAAIEAIWTGRP
ncbi:MAG: hypothetical protein ACRD1Y_13095 [Terriglobales bacterium]